MNAFHLRQYTNTTLEQLQQQWVSDKLMEANVKYYTKQD